MDKVSGHYKQTWCVFVLFALRVGSRVLARLELTDALPVASDKLAAALDELERAVRPGSGAGGAPTAPSAEALSAAQRRLVAAVLPELGALRLFVVLNYTAVVKARTRVSFLFCR
jgi:hypothetical protein